MLVNKQYKVVFKNDNFWKEKFYLEFPSAIKFGYPKFLEKFLRKRKSSWKEIYELLGTRENFELFLKARFIFGEKEEEERTFDTWENKFILFYKKIKQLEKMMKNFINLKRFGNSLELFELNENITIPIKPKDHVFPNERPYYILLGDPLRVYYLFGTEDKSFVLEFLKMVGKNRKKSIFMVDFPSDTYLIWYLVYSFTRTLRDDVDVMIEAISLNPAIITSARDKIRDNKEIMLMIVKVIGMVLLYASERLKQDEEMVFEAVKSDWEAFQYAHHYRKNDRAFIKKLIIEVNSHVFQFATLYLKNDKSYILYLINLAELNESDKYVILRYIGDELKRDMSFILTLININPFYLKYASNELKNNKIIVLEAIKKEYSAFKYAGDMLRNNEEFVMSLVNKIEDFKILEFMGDRLKNNKDFIFDRVWKMGSQYFEYASNNLKNDKKFVIHLIKNTAGFVLEHASNRIRDDFDVVYAAVKGNGLALKYASDRLRDDKTIVLEAIKQNRDALKYASKNIQFYINSSIYSLF